MKMKPTLQKRLNEEQKQRNRYKKQYGIEDENIVVVEKRSTVKAIAEILRQFIRWLAIAAIALLSLSGLYAWLYLYKELNGGLQAAVQEIQTLLHL